MFVCVRRPPQSSLEMRMGPFLHPSLFLFFPPCVVGQWYNNTTERKGIDSLSLLLLLLSLSKVHDAHPFFFHVPWGFDTGKGREGPTWWRMAYSKGPFTLCESKSPFINSSHNLTSLAVIGQVVIYSTVQYRYIYVRT